jgi:hypothetical protein
MNVGERLNDPLDLPIALLGLHLRDHFADEPIKIDFDILDLLLTRAGKGQQILNQRTHLVRRFGNIGQEVPTLISKNRLVIFR